jgi:hypothetical protein
MNQSAIYIKTDKGQIEIATRQHRLPSRSRSLLIMIDGHRTAMDVLANSSSVGEAEIYFRQLIADGFVHELGAMPAVQIAAKQNTASSPLMQPQVQTGDKDADALLALKKYVLQILRDVLGREDAAAFRLLVHGAQSAAEVGGIIPLHRDIPWSSRNRHRSDDYLLLGRRLGQEQETAGGA